MALLLVQTWLNRSTSRSRSLQAFITALEVLLLSAGLLSTLEIMKASHAAALLSILAPFWNTAVCFFSSPLYIFVIVNFIVLLIAASSAFHLPNDDEIVPNFDDDADDTLQISKLCDMTPLPLPSTLSSPASVPSFLDEGRLSDESHEVKKLEYLSSSSSFMLVEKEMVTLSHDHHSKDGQDPHEEENALMLVDKEMVTLSHDHHSKDIQDPHEEGNTLEAMWKVITGEGETGRKKKHIKKCETWDVPPSRSTAVVLVPQLLDDDSEELLPKWEELRKSETFNDAVSVRSRGGLIRDPSVTLEEFNNQVEAFIKTFNDNMRLQRQESNQRFLEMIYR